MLKRLIEVALPLKEVSEQSAREKSIRHGHISTLHIWWARRPLAACRAVVFASLIPDPDDPECPESFRKLVMEVLPKGGGRKKEDGGAAGKDGRRKTEDGGKDKTSSDLNLPSSDLSSDLNPPSSALSSDTPRNRCLEFIKHLVRWENSNNEDLVGKARKLIAAAHKFLHPESKGDMPKVLDPFAGGGAIPLEALRLGCEAHAIDLNPVAHLIELCTLVYPQKYGQPNSRPTPDYIRNLEASHGGKDGDGLFSKSDGKGRPSGADEIDGIALTRLPLITEVEYQKNPLAADVKFWGHWVLEKARDEIGQFYPPDPDGSIPVAYLWARTVKCPNPACGATIPLVRQLWLCKKDKRKVAMRMIADAEAKRCHFEVLEGIYNGGSLRGWIAPDADRCWLLSAIDPDEGTMQQGNADCPFCRQVAPVAYIRGECAARRMGQQLMAVVEVQPGNAGKKYRGSTSADDNVFETARYTLLQFVDIDDGRCIPTENIQSYEPRRVSPPLYGLNRFADLFNERQLLGLATVTRSAQAASAKMLRSHDADFARAVASMLAMPIDWFIDKESTLTRWHTSGEKISGTFGRQAIGMVWNYAEVNPLSPVTGGLMAGFEWTDRVTRATAPIRRAAHVRQGSATQLPDERDWFDAIVTDPPYYDAVPYSILSDFFYVWLKRLVGESYPELFRTPSTPKGQEAIEQRPHRLLKQRKDRQYYEKIMASAFSETRRTLVPQGVACVMFAHKSTAAWESLIAGLLQAGLMVSASWPLHTEMKTRMNARETASLASSVTMVCRKRLETAGEGYWDDVRDELRQVAHERLDFFWQQGIRGADFFISAIGPALSVYGRYAKVTRLTGEEVSVGQFLDEVRGIVTDYALSQILHGAKTGQIDAETRFYVLWKWSYGDAKVPADEAFKLAQALGIDTEEMWDRTGVLEKQGQNVQALTVAKRMRIKDLGEPLGRTEGGRMRTEDGASPPSSALLLPTLIDTLHRCCAFRDKGDTGGLSEYLARSGHGRNEKLWTVAQAISEVLPDGDKEKQLLQGLLNQRDKIAEAMAEERLF